MRRLHLIPLAALALTFIAPTALWAAENVNKGSLVVRDGAANTDANYAKEDKDPNGKLQGVSALCTLNPTERNRQNADSLIKTDKTRTWSATFWDGASINDR